MTTFPDHDDASEPLGTATLAPRLPCRAASWVSAAMGIVIFLAGGICGAAVVRMVPAHKPMMKLSELPERTAERMQRDFGLSDSQRQSVEQIVRNHQPELHRIRVQIFPEMRAALGQVIDEISGVLTPEQDKRFRVQAEHQLDVHFPAGEGTTRDQPEK